MVACVDMAFPVLLSPPYLSFSKPASSLSNTRIPGLGLGLGSGLGFQFQSKRTRIRRHLKLLIGAQLSNSFSFTFGLDSPVSPSFIFNYFIFIMFMPFGPNFNYIIKLHTLRHIFFNYIN